MRNPPRMYFASDQRVATVGVSALEAASDLDVGLGAEGVGGAGQIIDGLPDTRRSNLCQ